MNHPKDPKAQRAPWPFHVLGFTIAGRKALRFSRICSVMGHVALLFSAALIAPAAETIVVDADADRHPISPGIYGASFANQTQAAELNLSLNRWGGNTTTRYNWSVNADNRGNDWFYQSIGLNGEGAGAAVDDFIAQTKAAGARAMITIPIIDWIAKLGPGRSKLCSFSVTKYGSQQKTDTWMPDAGNGIRSDGQPISNNDPSDANTPNSPALQQSWVAHLQATWGAAASGPLAYYVLDNEPGIWHQSHRDVHPAGARMEEIAQKLIAYATAIKAVDPSALVVGPEEFGWDGYFWSGYDEEWRAAHHWDLNSPDRVEHGNSDYMPWLLDQMKAVETRTGKRILDVFSLHYYPSPDLQGRSIDSDDISPATQLARNRSTRSLWDPAYVDQSWIAKSPNGGSGGIVQLIPRMKSWVAAHYPGTKIALTEYRWGAEQHINGATTQADILGILGREGCDIAARWIAPDAEKSAPIFNAMRIYRNYDGRRSTFGDTSIRATVANPDNLAAFAAVRSADGALTVMLINKITTETTISVQLAHFIPGASTQVWQVTAAASTAIQHLADLPIADRTVTTTLPAQSITLLVIPPAAQPD